MELSQALPSSLERCMWSALKALSLPTLTLERSWITPCKCICATLCSIKKDISALSSLSVLSCFSVCLDSFATTSTLQKLTRPQTRVSRFLISRDNSIEKKRFLLLYFKNVKNGHPRTLMMKCQKSQSMKSQCLVLNPLASRS